MYVLADPSPHHLISCSNPLCPISPCTTLHLLILNTYVHVVGNTSPYVMHTSSHTQPLPSFPFSHPVSLTYSTSLSLATNRASLSLSPHKTAWSSPEDNILSVQLVRCSFPGVLTYMYKSLAGSSKRATTKLWDVLLHPPIGF